MQRPKIDQYFAKKGITVFYNTLGMTEELVQAYVAQFKPLLTQLGATRSQAIKQSCYETLYPIKNREKKTGFENLDAQDRAFRERIVQEITDVFYGPTMNIADHSGSTVDYKTCLVSSLKVFSRPVVYLSGGIDSELLARAFIDSGTPFKSVLFRWLDKTGQVINSYEIDYAVRFCQIHDLALDIIDLDVELLWESEKFAEFAKDIQIQSTHQLTHAWAVSIVENRYPGSTHLFGGEIRFFVNTDESDSKVNIVFLNKVDPPAYSGGIFFGTSSTGGSTSSCTLRYNNATGGYTVTGLNTGSSNSGIWTTSPSTNYEFQVTNVSTGTDFGSVSFTPNSWPTSWTPINTTTTTICRVECTTDFSEISDYVFFIDVRVVGDTGNIVSSSIQMSASTNV